MYPVRYRTVFHGGTEEGEKREVTRVQQRRKRMRQNHRKQNTKATYGEAVTHISPWDTNQCVGECKEVTCLYIDHSE